MRHFLVIFKHTISNSKNHIKTRSHPNNFFLEEPISKDFNFTFQRLEIKNQWWILPEEAPQACPAQPIQQLSKVILQKWTSLKHIHTLKTTIFHTAKKCPSMNIFQFLSASIASRFYISILFSFLCHLSILFNFVLFSRFFNFSIFVQFCPFSIFVQFLILSDFCPIFCIIFQFFVYFLIFVQFFNFVQFSILSNFV